MPGFMVDIEDASGARLGAGPLAQASSWRDVRRLDRAGAIVFDVPATDARTSLLAPRRYARCRRPNVASWPAFGLGIVDSIDLDTDGRVIAVSGDDLLRELAMRPAGPLVLKTSPTAPLALADALTMILSAANSAPAPAWTLDQTTYASTGATTTGSTTIASVTRMETWQGREGSPIYGAGIPAGATVASVATNSLPISAPATATAAGVTIHRSMVFFQAADESVLQLLSKLAEATSTHFRLGTGRQIVWLWSARPSSGIRAVTHADPVAALSNADVCLITGLSVVRDSSDLLSHVTPFGGTTADVRLMLADNAADPNKTTRTAPTGYTLDLNANTIRNDAALSGYGYFNRRQTWQNVTPALPGDASALVAARNQLFDVAFEFLRTRSVPQESYRLDITKLDRQLLPGDTIRVVYRGVVDGYKWLDINRDLLILESTTEITSDGLLTPAITVATIDRWPDDDVELLTAMLREMADARR